MDDSEPGFIGDPVAISKGRGAQAEIARHIMEAAQISERENNLWGLVEGQDASVAGRLGYGVAGARWSMRR